MRSIIIDDEAMSQAVVQSLCQHIDGISIVKTFSTAAEAISFLRTESVDLIFLDVEMPGMSGLDLLSAIPNLPQVIITSSKSDYALEAIGFHVTDYLQKPILLPRFVKAVERARQLHKEPMPTSTEEIYVRADGRLIRLLLNDINYVEGLGDYVIFHTVKKEKIIAHSTMKNIEDKISPSRFVRVHRSFIINLSKIVDIQDQNLVIQDRVIPISRAHKTSLFNLIQTI